MIRPIFTNSEGWSCPKTGTSIQRFALLTERPHIRTATRLATHKKVDNGSQI